MRILVTGGAGFLGSGVVESLVQNGHEVIVIDNCWRGTKENLRAVLDNITFIEGDACVTATYEMITIPSSVDLVYHLAAINGTKWFHEEPRMVMDVNLNSTLRSSSLQKKTIVATSSPHHLKHMESPKSCHSEG